MVHINPDRETVTHADNLMTGKVFDFKHCSNKETW